MGDAEVDRGQTVGEVAAWNADDGAREQTQDSGDKKMTDGRPSISCRRIGIRGSLWQSDQKVTIENCAVGYASCSSEKAVHKDLPRAASILKMSFDLAVVVAGFRIS